LFIAIAPPGQAVGEHQIGIGADAEAPVRHDAGQHREQHSGDQDGHGTATAGIHQTGEQAIQHRFR